MERSISVTDRVEDEIIVRMILENHDLSVEKSDAKVVRLSHSREEKETLKILLLESLFKEVRGREMQ